MVRSQNVLSVLMYLFEHHMKQSAVLAVKHEDLLDELEDVGFEKESALRAIAWLTDLHNIQKNVEQMDISANSTRSFTEEECFFIDAESRALLIRLVDEGVLTPGLRELVIHSLMTLDDAEELDLPLVKWVILMVLYNQPNKKDALRKMELLVLDPYSELVQ